MDLVDLVDFVDSVDPGGPASESTTSTEVHYVHQVHKASPPLSLCAFAPLSLLRLCASPATLTPMKRTIVALALLAACSSEKPTTTSAAQPAATPPTPAQARAIIEKSGEFSQHEFTNAAISLPVAGSSMNAPTRDLAKQLAAAGWLAIDGAGDIMLSDKSRSDKRFILRENGLLDIVPLAKKELGDVTAVRTNADGTVNADFTWHWIPNEVGATFTTGTIHDRFAGTQRATANLMWNGTVWAMISVEKE